MNYFIKTNIDLVSTFNCGQCFRWIPNTDGSYSGFAGRRRAIVRQKRDGVLFVDAEENELRFWERYFCADEEELYAELIERFSEDSALKAACEFAPGLRVLRQEPFETLISFIVSQNNNISRIADIVNKIPLLEPLADRQPVRGGFPPAGELARLGEPELEPLKMGYRARYILDAAKKVNSGEISLDEIAQMPYNEAKKELCKIVGVGDKVADCVLLFGFHMTEAFPRDVWIKRALEEYYPETHELPECTRGYEGIAQQFLFHYIRNCSPKEKLERFGVK